jgi:hypothetical protein
MRLCRSVFTHRLLGQRWIECEEQFEFRLELWWIERAWWLAELERGQLDCERG